MPMNLSDERIRSLFIVHFSVVVFTLGNSIAWTGVWPYLNLLDPNVEFQMLGPVVASDAAAQVVCSPFFGFLADRIGRIRPIALFLAVIFCIGDLFYANIALIPRSFSDNIDLERVWFMVVARVLVGIGTSINVAARVYVAKVTTKEERTTHTALLSMGQSMGLILGPAIQAGMTAIGQRPIQAESCFHFDMYTVVGYISCFTGVIVFILFLPGIFVEYNSPYSKVGDPDPPATAQQRRVAELNKAFSAEEEEADKKSEPEEEGRPKVQINTDTVQWKEPAEEAEAGEEGISELRNRKAPNAPVLSRKKALAERKKELTKQYSKVSLYSGIIQEIQDPVELDEATRVKIPKIPDIWVTSVCIVTFFCYFTGVTTVETILQPMTTHQFGWEDDEAILYVGLFVASQGVLASFVFAWIGPLAKRIDERLMLIFFGNIPMILSRLLMFPMSKDEPRFLCAPVILGNCTLDGYDINIQTINCVTPAEAIQGQGCPFCWCLDIPQLKVAQFMCASVIGACGYPFCLAICASLLSKALGPIDQGIWMALLTSAGGLARVLGPLVFASVYQDLGLYVMFGTLAGILGVALILNIVTFRRFKTVIDGWDDILTEIDRDQEAAATEELDSSDDGGTEREAPAAVEEAIREEEEEETSAEAREEGVKEQVEEKSRESD